MKISVAALVLGVAAQQTVALVVRQDVYSGASINSGGDASSTIESGGPQSYPATTNDGPAPTTQSNEPVYSPTVYASPAPSTTAESSEISMQSQPTNSESYSYTVTTGSYEPGPTGTDDCQAYTMFDYITDYETITKTAKPSTVTKTTTSVSTVVKTKSTTVTSTKKVPGPTVTKSVTNTVSKCTNTKTNTQSITITKTHVSVSVSTATVTKTVTKSK